MLSLSPCTLGHLAARQVEARGLAAPSLIVSMTAWKKESENNKRFVSRRWLEPTAAQGRENVSAQQHENPITAACQEHRSLQLVTDTAEVTRRVGGHRGGGHRAPTHPLVSHDVEPLQQLMLVS